MPGNATTDYDPNADHSFPDGRLDEILPEILDDPEVRALLEAQNVNPTSRLGYNDHGGKHVEIVRNRALRLYELLKESNVPFNGAADHDALTEADEPVIVALAATLHDVGHIIHRDRHTEFSISIAADVLDRLLKPYYPVAERVPMKGEILHAILCHHSNERPLTTEAGVIRIADALDMERGRSRIPYERGGRGINTISSQAIDSVELLRGEDTPVLVEITMRNAAGVYQIDGLLMEKLDGSGLEDAIRIVGINRSASDDQLLERIEL
ncbi:MAG: HD domain-containing protein [Halodesulfurarchaeum sp.]